MSERKQTPFKSSVTDFEALNTRLKELGIQSPFGNKNGVDVTPKEPEPPTDWPGYY